MAISNQIARLQTLRNSIRTKLINIGLLPAASTSATLSECYNVLSSVTGLSAMSYTPTTTAQTIASGQYLNGVQTINAIPSAYIIPSGTITLSSSGTFDVGSYASADVTATGGPSGMYYVYSNTELSVYNTNSIIESGIFGFVHKKMQFDNPSEIRRINSSAFAFYSGPFRQFSIVAENVNSIYQNAFAYAMITDAGSSIFFNNLQYISTFAFFQASIPSNIYMPLFSSGIADFAFARTSIRSISMPNVTRIGVGAFGNGEIVLGLSHEAFGPDFIFSTLFDQTSYYTFKPDLDRLSSTYVSSIGTKIVDAIFPKVSQVDSWAFYKCILLTNISFPICTSISSGAFAGCSGLTAVELPEVTTLGTAAFMGCKSLTSFYAPKLSILLSYTFKGLVGSGYASFGGTVYLSHCGLLSDVSLPELTTISGSANFYNCSALTWIDLPKLTTIIGGSNFGNCSALIGISLPELTTISGFSNFGNCLALTSVFFPKYSYTSYTSSMFEACRSLSFVSFPATSRLSGAWMFRNCNNLISMFLLGSSVCQLGNTIVSMLSSTPISTYSTSAYRHGSVFVPQSLLATYKAATNWTTVSSKIFAYESYFGTIGSFGYVDPTWTPFYEEQIDPEFLIEYGNGWQDNVGIPLDDYGENHCIIEFDGVVYPLATYSSNAIRFGAPISGTSSYKWDYYPFHVNCAEGTIVCQTSESHTFKMYSQLP